MLRIRMLSGEEVASVPVDQLSNARALKQQLNRMHDLPTRFRQRLFLDGNPLDDSAQLASPIELQLVLLSYFTGSQMHARDLATASESGSATEVLSLRNPPGPRPRILHPRTLDQKRLK